MKTAPYLVADYVGVLADSLNYRCAASIDNIFEVLNAPNVIGLHFAFNCPASRKYEWRAMTEVDITAIRHNLERYGFRSVSRSRVLEVIAYADARWRRDEVVV